MHERDQSRLARALAFALKAHGSQTRKGTDVPYVSHLLQVAGLVFEHGGDADQAVAAILHDAVEDCHEVTLEQIEEEFGIAVTSIVDDCTDTGPDESPDARRPWKERKTDFHRNLEEVEPASALVIACDKKHNLACMVADVEEFGLSYLDRFSGSPPQQIWYYQGVLERLRGKIPPRLEHELGRLVDRLRDAVLSAPH
jgi:(p)ppGpp synthase/HD superfamily hydrolase